MLNEDDMRRKIFETVDPLLLAEYELELCEVQWRREKDGWVLRLFIDELSGDGKVALALLTDVSRHVGDFLDVEDLIDCKYRLEVSSPGFDRPLRKPAHFKRYIGSKALIKMKSPKNGQKKIKGTLIESDDEKLKIKLHSGDELELCFNAIKSANLIYEWS